MNTRIRRLAPLIAVIAVLLLLGPAPARGSASGTSGLDFSSSVGARTSASWRRGSG